MDQLSSVMNLRKSVCVATISQDVTSSDRIGRHVFHVSAKLIQDKSFITNHVGSPPLFP